LLSTLTANPRRSEGNFVFAELGRRSPSVRDALIAEGVLVRLISDRTANPLGLRIALPGEEADFNLLQQSLTVVLSGARV
jgi:histidinol-phosphate/aromatic aminotransferase/cobyric acid decarboxylase-like protein